MKFRYLGRIVLSALLLAVCRQGFAMETKTSLPIERPKKPLAFKGLAHCQAQLELFEKYVEACKPFDQDVDALHQEIKKLKSILWWVKTGQVACTTVEDSESFAKIPGRIQELENEQRKIALQRHQLREQLDLDLIHLQQPNKPAVRYHGYSSDCLKTTVTAIVIPCIAWFLMAHFGV